MSKVVLGVILFFHVCATFVLMAPWDVINPAPLLNDDHPIHTERIYIYREAFSQSGWPWGYDPAISAGLVITPDKDVGAKPIQVFGLMLPFLDPFTVEKTFLFLAVLLFPLWTLLACRYLGFSSCATSWIMLFLIGPAWLWDMLPKYFTWGMVSFASASYWSPLVVALFLDFLKRPNRVHYLLVVLSGSMLFLLHIEGPVILIPALALLTICYRPFPVGWRLATMLVPIWIFILNAFWFVPFLMAYLGMPQIPYPEHMSILIGEGRHMTYGNWKEVIDALTPLRVGAAIGGVLLASVGLASMKKNQGIWVMLSFASAIGFGLIIKFGGSFVPIVDQLQPARFIVPTFVLMTIPVGVGFYYLLGKLKLHSEIYPLMATVLLVCLAMGLGKPVNRPIPNSLHELTQFVQASTVATDRLLIQSLGHGSYRPHIYPLLLERETMGNNFPRERDPSQFLKSWMFGKAITDWTPEELKRVLERWGISWVFTLTPEAQNLLAKVVGNQGTVVGEYRAFQFSIAPSRVLVGSGQVHAMINKVEIMNLEPEDGLVVLRYRFHPGWETTDGIEIFQFSVPEDPQGFIALKNPPQATTLVFNPWKALTSQWPNENRYMSYFSKDPRTKGGAFQNL